MTQEEKNFVCYCFAECFKWMDLCYIQRIYDLIADEVIKDVEECAGKENWHSGDVEIAIRRALTKRLGLEE